MKTKKRAQPSNGSVSRRYYHWLDLIIKNPDQEKGNLKAD